MATFVVKEGTSLGLKLPVRRSSRYGFFTPTTDILVQEKQNLLSLMMTNFGERPIHYDLGMNIDHLMFEQQTDILKQKLIDNITNAASKWLPHLTLTRLDVFSKEDDINLQEHEVKISLDFHLLDNPEMFDTIEILVGR